MVEHSSGFLIHKEHVSNLPFSFFVVKLLVEGQTRIYATDTIEGTEVAPHGCVVTVALPYLINMLSDSYCLWYAILQKIGSQAHCTINGTSVSMSWSTSNTPLKKDKKQTNKNKPKTKTKQKKKQNKTRQTPQKTKKQNKTK